MCPGVVGDGPVHDDEAKGRYGEYDRVGGVQGRVYPFRSVDSDRYHDDDRNERSGEEHGDVGVAPLLQEFEPLLERVSIDAPDARELCLDEGVVGDAGVDRVRVAVEHALEGVVTAPLGDRPKCSGVAVTPPADEALHLGDVARRDVLYPLGRVLKDLGPGHGRRGDRGHVGVHEEQVLLHLLVLEDGGPEVGETPDFFFKRYLPLVCRPQTLGDVLEHITPRW
ncbi:hypothetical protein DSECCO2_660750 [anaerobic digester metagenome]